MKNWERGGDGESAASEPSSMRRRETDLVIPPTNARNPGAIMTGCHKDSQSTAHPRPLTQREEKKRLTPCREHIGRIHYNDDTVEVSKCDTIDNKPALSLPDAVAGLESLMMVLPKTCCREGYQRGTQCDGRPGCVDLSLGHLTVLWFRVRLVMQNGEVDPTHRSHCLLYLYHDS